MLRSCSWALLAQPNQCLEVEEQALIPFLFSPQPEVIIIWPLTLKGGGTEGSLLSRRYIYILILIICSSPPLLEDFSYKSFLANREIEINKENKKSVIFDNKKITC